jgi:glycosyltransferase involved in cell wall biosynthesis
VIRVGWIADDPGYVGGGELTQRELRAAAPDDIEVVDMRPGEIAASCSIYAIHNCATYDPKEIAVLKDAPAVWKYWNDVGSWYGQDFHDVLADVARPICCSRLQADYMGLDDAALIPPPIDLSRFEDAAADVDGNRAGAVSVAQWRSVGKGAHAALEWAAGNGGADFYGGGVFAPEGSRELAYEGMPALLARYQSFVFLPTVIEPFGRLVVEAWAAGCELVVNELVGAVGWIRDDPGAIRTAAADYWALILG